MTPSNAELREAIKLRIAIGDIFAEYDKPSTTKTYPGQKTRVRRGVAIDKIVELFQARERKLLTELLEHKQTVKVMVNRRFVTDENFEVIPVSVIEKLKQTNDGGKDE